MLFSRFLEFWVGACKNWGVAKPWFESRPAWSINSGKMESNPREFPGFKRLRAAASSSGFRDTVTFWCCNLPWVGQLLVDEPGGLAIPSSLFPIRRELWRDGVRRDGAQARGVSRPASKFVDGYPRPAARVREVDGIDCFLPSLLPLLLKPR